MEAIVIGVVIALINVIGGGLVIKWLAKQINAMKGTITAMNGTVAAQAKTLKTIGEVNRTVLEVFKVLDPERWAKEVQVHKKLADEKAEAMIEDERRKLREDATRTGVNLVNVLMPRVEGYLMAALIMMLWVPKQIREQLINGMKIPDELKGRLIQHGMALPDLELPGPSSV